MIKNNKINEDVRSGFIEIWEMDFGIKKLNRKKIDKRERVVLWMIEIDNFIEEMIEI